MHITKITQNNLTVQGGLVSYLRFGTGKHILIALHGHGDSARTFAVLQPALAERYTVYAIDLPFHGKTKWEKAAFSSIDLLEIIDAVCVLEKKEQFAIMGFSFGCRALFTLIPSIGVRVRAAFFIAPDGIDTPSLRKMFLTPNWMREALYHLLKKPNWLLHPTRFLYSFGLFPKQSMRFLENNLTRPHRIQRAFGMWRSIDAFKTNPKKTAQTLNEHTFPVSIFLAHDDPFIPFGSVKNFAATIPTATLFPISKGHWIIDETLGDFIKKHCL